MNYLRKRIFGILIAVTASFILATHYAFQWYTSILVCIAILGMIVGLNWFANQRIKNDKNQDVLRFASFVLIVLIFVVTPKYEGAEDYEDCQYPPFKIIEETEMDYKLDVDSYYYEDEDFTGFISSPYTSVVSGYDIETNEEFFFSFNYELNPMIRHLTYFEGYVYVSGSNLVATEISDVAGGNYLYRYNVKTHELEELYPTWNANQIGAFAGELYVASYIDGVRKIRYYDGDFNLLRTENDDEVYLYRVDRIEDMDIVQQSDGIFLYRDGLLRGAFDDYNVTWKNVYYTDEKFYITSEYMEGGYFTDVYDVNANYLYTNREMEFEDEDNYLLFSDNYLIKNSVNLYYFSFSEVFTSHILDQSGEYVCNTTSMDDIHIIYKGQQLYGVYNDMTYEIEELHYTVPIRYEYPQHGFVYYVSIIGVAIFVVRKKSLFL